MPGSLFIKIAVLPFFIWAFVLTSVALGAAPNDAVLKAKREAESSGYIFVASKDEIIAKAKKEGRLRAVSGISGSALQPMVEAFKKKYPFIDPQAVEIEGAMAYQRFLLELKAGTSNKMGFYLPPLRQLQGVPSLSDEIRHSGDGRGGNFKHPPKNGGSGQPQHRFRQHGRAA